MDYDRVIVHGSTNALPARPGRDGAHIVAAYLFLEDVIMPVSDPMQRDRRKHDALPPTAAGRAVLRQMSWWRAVGTLWRRFWRQMPWS